MNINGYMFEGPYGLDANFNIIGAVYVVSDVNNTAIDVGQTDNLKQRIPSHERQACWHRNAVGEVSLYVRVEPSEETRLQIERLIRNSNEFCCGVY